MAFDRLPRRFRVKSAFPALGASAFLCLAFAGAAPAATIITGIANITGSVTVGATTIDFAAPFIAQSTQTGSFTGETGGTIDDTSLSAPVGTPIDVAPFATFVGGMVNPIYFDLTEILPGTGTLAGCTNAIGVACTPTGSPFTLTQEVLPSGNTAGIVDVTLNLLGVSGSTDPATGGSPTTAGFTTQLVLTGTTVTSILASLSSGGTVTSSYSATFDAIPPTTTPEPGTEVLFGAGLIGLSLVGRRRFRRS